MVKIIQLADDGSAKAEVVLDDFTVEVIYSGIADMLRDAAAATETGLTPSFELPHAARQRREKILSRIRS